MKVKTPEHVEENLRRMCENIKSALLPMKASAATAEEAFKELDAAFRSMKQEKHPD